MKVNGLGQITTSSVKSRKAGASSDGSFVDALSEGEEAEAAGAASTAAPLSSLSSLLALQEMPTSTDGRSKGLARVQNMLDGLEDIRVGLLAGEIPESKLRSLSALVRQSRDGVTDPKLTALLDDVELRVEVELAKLEMGGS